MTSMMRRGDSEVRNPTKDWLYLNIVHLSQDGFHTIRKVNIIASASHLKAGNHTLSISTLLLNTN
jgi:hypothetical protein